MSALRFLTWRMLPACGFSPNFPLKFILLAGLTFVCLGCGSEENTAPKSAEFIVEAREALEAGDQAKALQALDSSIDAEPTVWGYALRAKLYAETGRDTDAAADCEAGLQIDPSNQELMWIKAELEKPAAKRFKTESVTANK